MPTKGPIESFLSEERAPLILGMITMVLLGIFVLGSNVPASGTDSIALSGPAGAIVSYTRSLVKLKGPLGVVGLSATAVSLGAWLAMREED